MPEFLIVTGADFGVRKRQQLIDQDFPTCEPGDLFHGPPGKNYITEIYFMKIDLKTHLNMSKHF